MVYIWAWHGAALPPERLISSRINPASSTPRPAPPYCSGIRAASQPASVSARTNSSGYWRASSAARQYSGGNFPQSSRISWRICCWSAVSSKSILVSPRVDEIPRRPTGSGRAQRASA